MYGPLQNDNEQNVHFFLYTIMYIMKILWWSLVYSYTRYNVILVLFASLVQLRAITSSFLGFMGQLPSSPTSLRVAWDLGPLSSPLAVVWSTLPWGARSVGRGRAHQSHFTAGTRCSFFTVTYREAKAGKAHMQISSYLSKHNLLTRSGDIHLIQKQHIPCTKISEGKKTRRVQMLSSKASIMFLHQTTESKMFSVFHKIVLNLIGADFQTYSFNKFIYILHSQNESSWCSQQMHHHKSEPSIRGCRFFLMACW